MSYFYGNITNPAYRQFQFDKIYPNKVTMDKDVYNDDVYQNRFVLISYDTPVNLNEFANIYDLKEIAQQPNTYKGYFKKDENAEEKFFCTQSWGILNQNKIFKDENNNLYNISPQTLTQQPNKISLIQNTTPDTSYTETSDLKEPKLEPEPEPAAIFEPLINDSKNEITQKEINSIIEEKIGGTKKKYDSTVWMKVFKEEEADYVFIADISKSINELTVVSENTNILNGGNINVVTGIRYDASSNKIIYSTATQNILNGQSFVDQLTNAIKPIKDQIDFYDPKDEKPDLSKYITARVTDNKKNIDKIDGYVGSPKDTPGADSIFGKIKDLQSHKVEWKDFPDAK